MSVPQKHINHFTILIDRTPKIVLLALDLHKDFIDEEGIAIALMPALQSPRIPRPKLDAPQTNRLIADDNAALSE